MRFLGIDFGWVSQPSGVCCLDWQAGELHLLTLERCTDLPQVLDWVDLWLPSDYSGGVAVDAPTVIANATGMRPCDRQAHRYFGKYDAGCYPANLRLSFASRTLALGLALETRGGVA
ncbi:MAG: DUF429 domain-containing protein [Kaiparowitsia implicata GSE-PSE-MK54-09C]|jgi:predicted RNase H-like nuclease|nr:DUF429 domain-containing protein [Kaiparowitsia implicata GSE-PSE-MK54-09C]